MEIERKFLVKKLPEDLATYPCHQIEQGYLCTDPVVRIRRQDHEYYLTYKSAGLMTRSEYNLPLNEEAYGHLKAKTDGNLITKKRYCIPISEYLTVELDIFEGPLPVWWSLRLSLARQRERSGFFAPGLVWR